MKRSGTVKFNARVFPAVQCDSWFWSGTEDIPLSFVDRAFFLVGVFRSNNFILLTLKKKNNVVLAVDLVEGTCRHTMSDAEFPSSFVHVDEISGYSAQSQSGWAVVHGFQYTRLPSGQLRLVVVTPDGDLQESYSDMHPSGFDSLSIGPSPGLVLHELCMFPYTSLTDRQMVEVFTELRNRWY